MDSKEILPESFITEIFTFCAAKAAQNLELMETQFLILKKISQKIMIDNVLDKTIHNFSEKEIEELRNEYGKQTADQFESNSAAYQQNEFTLDKLESLHKLLLADEQEFLKIKSINPQNDISYSDFLTLLTNEIQKRK